MNLRSVLSLVLILMTLMNVRSQIASSEINSLLNDILKINQLKKGAQTTLEFPISDTEWEHFSIVETETSLPKELKQKYPKIKSYRGFSKSAELTLTLTENEFFGTIKKGKQLIDLRKSISNSFGEKPQYLNSLAEDSIDCRYKPQPNSYITKDKKRKSLNISRGSTLRTYALVLTLTGRQNQVMGITTKEQGLAYANSILDFVNSIFRRELAVEFELHPENDKVIYLNPEEDPFPESDVNDMVEIINTNNTNNFELFDDNSFQTGLVIHPSNIGRGGGRPCNASRASVGSCACLGLILHELGHHLGGVHTYHLDGSEEITEVQKSMVGNNSTYLHSLNFDRIAQAMDNKNCGTVSTTGNSVPLIEVDFDGVVIPANTSFVLKAGATDPDIDANLTYTWQHAQGGANEESKLLFAHKAPSSEGHTRHIPSLASQLENTIDRHAVLPTVDRIINTRIMTRDNQLPVGAVTIEEVKIQVDATAGPFKVTHPNESVQLESNTPLEIKWDVANTDNERINAQEVAIYFSSDFGKNWSLLMEKTPNDGSHDIILPDIASAECRIKVMATGNIFYDINDVNFEIIPQQESTETQGDNADSTPIETFEVPDNQIETDPQIVAIEVAQAFTPNNDGLNDVWIINKIEDYPDNTIRVFDKSGKVVFSALGYQNDWTGAAMESSEKVPPGPYYYRIKINEHAVPESGWIFINY